MLNQANTEFWDELCGTTFAQARGLTGRSPEMLKQFDTAYFDFYPYLLKYLKLEQIAQQRVLEIGLGYGTVGQKLAEAGANYCGLDLAAGPVKMLNYRLQMANLPGQAIQGSALQIPFATESFDRVVSIGCFHHTGNVKRCIEETYRVLKPNGQALIMVYNRFSYLQWRAWPRQTWQALLNDLGLSHKAIETTESQRMTYDTDSQGRAAPETTFCSSKQLTAMFGSFSRRPTEVKIHKENTLDLTLRGHLILPRQKALSTIGKWCGLDLYIEVQK